MSFRKPFELQRLLYWQGQMLRSRDFRDQVVNEAHLRWWHNRALHNTFGIVCGFEVKMNTAPVGCADVAVDFEPDGQSVIVCPGLAYDCFGRELILVKPYRVAIPPIGTDLTLLARYQDTDEYPRRDKVAGACLPEATSRLVERPVFDWKRSDQVEIRDGVPLAKLNGGFQPYNSVTHCAVRPLARLRIANGATLSGNTAWRVWEIVENGRLPILLGLEVEIDTSAAGFTDTPCYFAWLQGSLWDEQLTVQLKGHFLPNDVSDNTVNLMSSLVALQLFASYFEHIHEPTQTGFTFRVWLPQLTRLFRSLQAREPLLTIAQTQQLSVCWLGIQPA